MYRSDPDPSHANAPSGAPERHWRAHLDMHFRTQGRQTVLQHRHTGPLRVQRPLYPEGGRCQVHLLHPPAGVVGGDTLDINVRLEAGAEAQVLTPGASLMYRSVGPTAHLKLNCELGDGAALEYLPHDTIHFNGARTHARTRIQLAQTARLIWRETHCFGRPESGEAFNRGEMRWRTDIVRDGAPIWTETTRVGAPNWVNDTAGMRSHAYTGTLLATPVDATECESLRAALTNSHTVITCVDDLLIARYLGDDGRAWRSTTATLWRALRPAVMGEDGTAPRIWST
ncbi:MAG: urease accessory protein UreD [Pseudomonadota bacterium]